MIGEDDIPELSDRELNRVVAEWLGAVGSECESCNGTGRIREPDKMRDCGWCNGQGWHVSLYTSDDAAAWQLYEAMPHAVSFRPKSDELSYAQDPPFEDDSLSPIRRVWDLQEVDLKRALAEAAATLAVHGVEPREVDDE